MIGKKRIVSSSESDCRKGYKIKEDYFIETILFFPIIISLIHRNNKSCLI
jgi:hypothetical protein